MPNYICDNIRMIPLKKPMIHKISGDMPGHNISIIVGVHGNEKGPQYEWEWLKSLKILSGNLFLIFANPTAADQNKRFINTNLNRRFGKMLSDYPEDKLARIIEETLDKCDASLDLHMYNEHMDAPFVICGESSNEISSLLPAKYIINIPDPDAGGTDDYMSASGKIGICFETGSVERPKEYSQTIRAGVMSFLGYYKLIENQNQETEKPTILKQSLTKFINSKDIIFTKEYNSFDPVKSGEIICVEDGQDITSPIDGYILFPRPNNPIGAEAYYILVE